MDTVKFTLCPNTTFVIDVLGYGGQVVITYPLEEPPTVDVITDETDPDRDETFQLSPIQVPQVEDPSNASA